MTTSRSDVSLTRGDEDWLQSLEDSYARSPEPLPVRREGLLREVRARLKADLLQWAVLQYDANEEAAMLEFFNDADEDTADKAERARRWLRLGNTLNITPANNEIFRKFLKKKPHLTVTQGDLSEMDLSVELRTVVRRVMAAPLLLEWRRSGMGDFMFTLYSQGNHDGLEYGSGVGYHRLVGREPWGKREQLLAHAVSCRNPWIHAIGVDTRFPAVSLKKQYRLLLPFLLRSYTVGEIAAILERSTRTIEKQILAIAKHMGLREPDWNRNAIRECFRLRVHPDPQAGDPAADLVAGLDSLR